MNGAALAVGEQYASALEEHLAGAQETALVRAYEAGRQASESGLGVLDMLSIHHEALMTLLRRASGTDESARIVQAAGNCLTEGLAPFEMTHRGFRETIATLRKLNAELEAANRELEAFSYSASHDLRAPLRAIDGFSKIVVEDYQSDLPPEAQRYLQVVRANAQQMGRLIDDLLALSRLSRQPVRRRTVELRHIVEEVFNGFAPDLEDRAVDLRIGSLPPCAADPNLLKQLYMNLLSNAVKFTRRTPVTQIEVGSFVQAGEVVYFVKDNGVGFDMRYADKLFQVFQRLHRQEEYEGTGVGLAIVHRIVHRHGGRVWAEGEIDKGAAFYFTLGGTGDGERSGGDPAR